MGDDLKIPDKMPPLPPLPKEEAKTSKWQSRTVSKKEEQRKSKIGELKDPAKVVEAASSQIDKTLKASLEKRLLDLHSDAVDNLEISYSKYNAVMEKIKEAANRINEIEDPKLQAELQKLTNRIKNDLQTKLTEKGQLGW